MNRIHLCIIVAMMAAIPGGVYLGIVLSDRAWTVEAEMEPQINFNAAIAARSMYWENEVWNDPAQHDIDISEVVERARNDLVLPFGNYTTSDIVRINDISIASPEILTISRASAELRIAPDGKFYRGADGVWKFDGDIDASARSFLEAVNRLQAEYVPLTDMDDPTRPTVGP